MSAHAYSKNRAHGSIFGTWFPFRNERLDDLDCEPRISANRFSPPGCVQTCDIIVIVM